MRRMQAWYMRRRAGYAGRAVHEIVVPAGPEGRPGERVLAPSRSLYAPRALSECGSRQDFRVVIGPRGTTFAAVCLGRVTDIGEPVEAAWESIGRLGRDGFSGSRVVEEKVAGEPGCRYTIAFPGPRLTEWKFARDGWLFVAGALCVPGDDEPTMVDRARALLATWRWLDARSGTTGT